ncbi:MAG TPA: 50S ribosomal protein L13 [Candidatus Saccharimonadales bacterium]|nr:50S ribosomal protein L13 [Candidatus Saccharimonadales bacterium]
MKTTKPKDIKKDWHLIDAKNQILGRISTKVAHLLMGKNKPYYTPLLDCGDYVVVINAKNVALSGKKETQKLYYRYSGYPGGLRSRTTQRVRETKPEEIIRHAVVGMLPKNKMGKLMVKKLYIYPDSQNPHLAKFISKSN